MGDGSFDVTTGAAVAACRRDLPATATGGDVVFGFDGMIDDVRELVDTRDGPDSYTPVRTLDDFADRLRASADADSSIALDWVRTGRRLGGHTAHLARFFGRVGYDPTMVGTYGRPVHDAFAAEFGDCELVSLGDPGRTQAVEFTDGKCMLAEAGSYLGFDWDALSERVSPAALADHIDGARLLGVGYWTVVPALPSVLDGLREEVWPRLAAPPDHVLVDPGDVRQLDASRIASGAAALDALDETVPVTLSANRVETHALAAATGRETDSFAEAVRAVRDAFGVTRVVGHNVQRSLLVSDAGSVSVRVPRVSDPAMTTSAGDHFNAGLALGLLEGLDEPGAVALGNAVASEFVRTGEPPSLADVATALATYEDRLTA
jgi:hypothetical protein